MRNRDSGQGLEKDTEKETGIGGEAMEKYNGTVGNKQIEKDSKKANHLPLSTNARRKRRLKQMKVVLSKKLMLGIL